MCQTSNLVHVDTECLGSAVPDHAQHLPENRFRGRRRTKIYGACDTAHKKLNGVMEYWSNGKIKNTEDSKKSGVRAAEPQSSESFDSSTHSTELRVCDMEQKIIRQDSQDYEVLE